jgi:hypothetical protein
VKGSQAKVSRLGKRHRGLHSFGIADFADENDVGRLPQSIFKRRLERMGVESNLTLSDDGFFVPVDKFNGVFDGDDVTGFRSVTVVDHGSQSSRFAGSRGPDHQHQPALRHGDVFQYVRQIEFP